MVEPARLNRRSNDCCPCLDTHLWHGLPARVEPAKEKKDFIQDFFSISDRKHGLEARATIVRLGMQR